MPLYKAHFQPSSIQHLCYPTSVGWMYDSNFPTKSNLKSPIAAKNLLQTATFQQLWILLTSAWLSSHLTQSETAQTSRENLFYYQVFLTSSLDDCLWLEQLSPVLILLLAKKKQKTATLGGFHPPSVFMIVYVSNKAISTWSFDLWTHSSKSLLCSWEHYWILTCRCYSESSTELMRVDGLFSHLK